MKSCFKINLSPWSSITYQGGEQSIYEKKTQNIEINIELTQIISKSALIQKVENTMHLKTRQIIQIRHANRSTYTKVKRVKNL